MQNFIFTRALVFGAIAQLLFPRHSFPTIELAAPAVPWQLLLWVSAPHCPPIVPTPAKSTRTKCSPGFGQENLIVHDISSTDSAHTVDALSFCCIALHTPGGAGGDGGEGGDGDGGDGGGASGAPNIIALYVCGCIQLGGFTPKNLCAMFSAISSAPSPQSAGWNASFAMKRSSVGKGLIAFAGTVPAGPPAAYGPPGINALFIP